MGFHNVLFPTAISWGSASGPGFDVSVIEGGNRIEQRVLRDPDGAMRADIAFGIRKHSQIQIVSNFYRARRGRFYSFRYLNPLDNSSRQTDTYDEPEAITNTDQFIGIGDGTTTTYQLAKTYDDDVAPFQRPIYLPVESSVIVAVDGVPDTTWSVDDTTGLLTFTAAPGTSSTYRDVTAGFRFHDRMRFDIGREALQMALADFSTGGRPSIPLVEDPGVNLLPDLYSYGGSRNWGSVSTDLMLSISQGRSHLIAPTVSIDAYLPDALDIPDGVLHFLVSNTGGIGNDITIRNLDETALKVLQPSKTVMIHLAKNTLGAKVWQAFGG